MHDLYLYRILYLRNHGVDVNNNELRLLYLLILEEQEKMDHHEHCYERLRRLSNVKNLEYSAPRFPGYRDIIKFPARFDGAPLMIMKNLKLH